MRMLLVVLLLANVMLGIYNIWPSAAAPIDSAQRELAPERIEFLTPDQARARYPKAAPRPQ